MDDFAILSEAKKKKSDSLRGVAVRLKLML